MNTKFIINVFVIKKGIVLTTLFFISTIAYASWEQVSLDDKSDFDTNCEYRAEIHSNFKLCSLKTQFSSILNKKIGYLPRSDGIKPHFYVMSNNKAVLRFETETGSLINEREILKLEKNCPKHTLEMHSEQKGGEINDTYTESNKSNLNKTHDGPHFGLSF